MKTIVQTPEANYTCYYIPGAPVTYTTCTSDQSDALKISLAIGFFLAVFLSFLKQIPKGGTPPLADEDEEGHVSIPESGAPTGSGDESKTTTIKTKKPKKRIYRRGVL